MMDVKPSPLVLSLSELYKTFRDIDPEILDGIMIESRFDLQLTTEEVRRRYPSDEVREESDEVSGWYQGIDINIGLSNPHRDVKVVRLDTDAPANSPRLQ